ncbi:hypothetical protein BDW59DRAFT_12953 [Aspergillus cavernicola]|uniref:Uncharacterized protein n=1 Tax=Aspergillus cavernicola TaxID=176166 RepID=A0ABR4HKI0_9EURO
MSSRLHHPHGWGGGVCLFGSLSGVGSLSSLLWTCAGIGCTHSGVIKVRCSDTSAGYWKGRVELQMEAPTWNPHAVPIFIGMTIYIHEFVGDLDLKRE